MSHLHVLLVLAGGDAHGYRIMLDTSELTGGEVTLRPGALHAALGRLVGSGLIVETDERPAEELDDERRRYYRITGAGRQALAAEVARMARVVDHARGLPAVWSAR
jgi:DNA-binding PadR family transcriptional regulator